MPFVTQSRLESKHGVVQRTGLSCFLCPGPPLTVEAAALKCLQGWPGQLYKHLLSSQHMPCPGLERRDERWAFLCPLEAHCLVMEGTGTLMGHAGVAASRCATLSSLQRTCCRMQLADCPQLASPPPAFGIHGYSHMEATTSLGSWSVAEPSGVPELLLWLGKGSFIF